VLDGDSLQRRTKASLSVFVDWCAKHRVRGCIGEMGVPRGQGGPPGDGLRWAELLRQTIAYLTANEISALLWAADSCLGAEYELALYRALTPGGSLATTNPAGQATEGWVLRHPDVFLGLGNHSLANADHRDGFSNKRPGVFGTDYFREARSSFAYLASRGHRLVRLAFRWERMQPVLGEELDESYLAHLRAQVDEAASCGLSSVLDLHNYGEYVAAPGWQGAAGGGPGRWTIGAADGRLREEHLHDLWRRLSRQFRGHRGVFAYGLMNEPHDLAPGLPDAAMPEGGSGSRLWERISNSTVNALRRDGDGTLILVAGYEWSKADRWQSNHERGAWIDDPAGAHVYEAHYYPDGESSRGGSNDSVFGRYSYDQAVLDATTASY
jgi:hypothetical protein